MCQEQSRITGFGEEAEGEEMSLCSACAERIKGGVRAAWEAERDTSEGSMAGDGALLSVGRMPD